MPTQNLSRTGKVYVSTVILGGSLAIAASVVELLVAPVGFQWFILAALTIVSGSATVKLPSVPASLSVSETFVFTSVLLFGAPAGTLTVALDGLIISLWLNKRRKEIYRVLFNMAAPAASIWIAAQLFFALAGIRPLVHEQASIGQFLAPLLVFTVVYFLLNSWLIAFAVAFETGERPIRIWQKNFVWLSLNFFCGASVAALLTVYPRKVDLTYLGAILPLLLVLYLTYRTSMARVEDANQHLAQINEMYLSTIETLAMAIDAKDQVTHGHIRRVQNYALALAKALHINDPGLIRAMEAASLLHDMGKLAVPEHILNKPGKLTRAEFERMKLHANIGADILSSIRFPYPVIPIVRHHHENWDGTGYPHGLRGTDIPVGARILAVVDCFDALTSDRPYRRKLSDSDAIGILLDRRGKMYDPLIVDTFMRVKAEISADEAPPATDAHNALMALTSLIATNKSSRLRPESIDFGGELLREAFAICQALDSLALSGSAEDPLPNAARHLQAIGRSDLFVLFGYERQADCLIPAFSSNEEIVDNSFEIAVGQRLSGWVAANRVSVLNAAPALDATDRDDDRFAPFKSVMSVPLSLGDLLVGVACFYSKVPDAYLLTQQRLCEVIAPHLALLMTSQVLVRGELTLPATRSARTLKEPAIH